MYKCLILSTVVSLVVAFSNGAFGAINIGSVSASTLNTPVLKTDNVKPKTTENSSNKSTTNTATKTSNTTTVDLSKKTATNTFNTSNKPKTDFNIGKTTTNVGLGKNANTGISDSIKNGKLGSVNAGLGKAQDGMANKGGVGMSMEQMAGLSGGGAGTASLGLFDNFKKIHKDNTKLANDLAGQNKGKDDKGDGFKGGSSHDPFVSGSGDKDDPFASGSGDKDDPFASGSDDDDDPFTSGSDDDDDDENEKDEFKQETDNSGGGDDIDDDDDELGPDGDSDFSGKGDWGKYGGGVSTPDSEAASEAFKHGVTDQVGGGLDNEESNYGGGKGNGKGTINASGGGQGTVINKVGEDEYEDSGDGTIGLAMDPLNMVANFGDNVAMTTGAAQNKSANTARSVLPRAVKVQPVYNNAVNVAPAPVAVRAVKTIATQAVPVAEEEVQAEEDAQVFAPKPQNVNIGRKAIAQKATTTQTAPSRRR